MTPEASTMRKTNSERNLNHKKWQRQHIKQCFKIERYRSSDLFLKHKMINIEMYQVQAHKVLREKSSTSWKKKQILQRAQEEWNEWIIDSLYIFSLIILILLIVVIKRCNNGS